MEETVLTFQVPGHTGSGEFYVDIAKAMSIVNRKLNRQQGLWSVLGMNFFVQDTTLGTGIPYEVAVSGAPRNWVTRNALVKIFNLWIDQQRHVQDSLDNNIRPRWEDFKVYLNGNHRVSGDLVPVSGHPFGGVDAYQAGEWVHSKIVFEEVDGAGLVVEHEPELHILGPDNGDTNKGIINQYAISRAYPVSPDPALPNVASSLYAEATDPLAEQMQEIALNMSTDNNEPPYDVDAYPGGASNGIEPLLYAYGANTNTLGRKVVLNGFSVPNGLLEIQVDAGSVENPAEVYFQLIVGRRSDY